MDSRNSGSEGLQHSVPLIGYFPKPAEKLRASTKSTVTGMETGPRGQIQKSLLSEHMMEFGGP